MKRDFSKLFNSPRGRYGVIGSAAMIVMSGSLAFAAGYEKPDLFSAKHQAVGGGVTATINDARSLYFNPAGLVGTNLSEGATEVTVDFSPFSATAKAPFMTGVPTVEKSIKTKPELLKMFSVFMKKKYSDQLGYGLGLYTIAGSGANFGKQYVGQPTQPEVNVAVGALEFGAGVGYQLNSEWNLGLGWRGSFISGTMAMPAGATVGLKMDGLTGTDYAGFKVGAQYHPTDCPLTYGFTYRTQVDWKLTGGKIAMTDLSSGAALPTSTDGEIAMTLPSQISLGVEYKASEDTKYVAQYDLTAYSQSDMVMKGTMGGVYTTQKTEQHFSDQSTIRLGFEKGSADELPLRLGFIYNSRVSDPAHMNMFLVAPGPEYTVTGGTGKKFSDTLTGDLALAYSTVSGAGKGNAGGYSDGDYSIQMYTLHTSINYLF